MPATPALKLTYFDMGGRASMIRKALALGGVPFIDERVSRDELEKLKPSLPYGKIPVLEVDGEVLAETMPILRYVGRLTGLYPPPHSEPVAAALVDELFDTLDDLFERQLMSSFVETDAEKRKQMREALLAGPLSHAFELVDTRLAQVHAHAYFRDDATKVTLIDVAAWNFVDFVRSGVLDHVPTTFIDKYESFVASYDKVERSVTSQQPRGGAPQDAAAAASVSPPTPTPTPPQKLVLTYFDMPGRAEQIRVALCIGGVAFDDVRLSFEEVDKRKREFPNEQVPVLRVDDAVTLAQSVAILRYVGSFTGLYPTDDALHAARVDEIVSHIGELFFALDPSFVEKDPASKKAMREQLMAATIPASLASLDKRIAHWKQRTCSPKTPFALGGDKPTIADVSVYSLVTFLQSGFLDHVPTTIVDAYAEILQSCEAVKTHPRVQQWRARASQPAV